jgi:hypothetical protein
MNITAADIDVEEIDAAVIEFETHTGTESLDFSRKLIGAMDGSQLCREIMRRLNTSDPRARTGVSLQAGIEIGLILAQNITRRKARFRAAGTKA